MPSIPNIDRGVTNIVDTKRKNSYNVLVDDLPIEFICNPSKWKQDQINNPTKKRKSRKDESTNDNSNNTGIV